MALTKTVSIDRIEILEDGKMQVRRTTKVLEDGVEIGKTYHRSVLAPGDDVVKQDSRVQSIAGVVWTPAVVTAYKEKEAAAAAAIEK